MSEIIEIDDYLSGMSSRQELVGVHPVLCLSTMVRQKIYTILHQYHRKKLKKEIEDAHLIIFNDLSTRELKNTVMDLFKPERR